MTRGLSDEIVPILLSGSFWTSTDGRRFSIHVVDFDKVWETAVAVSLREGLTSLFRELGGFLWSSWGADTESGIDELGRAWGRVN